MNSEKSPSYRQLVDKFVNEIQKEFPVTFSEIAENVAKMKNDIEFEDSEIAKTAGYTKQNIHGNVSNAIKLLVRDGKMYKYGDKEYYPGTIESLRIVEHRTVIDTIDFTRRDVHAISAGTIVVEIGDFNDEKKELLKKYIGVENVYDIVPFADKAVIMLKPTKGCSDKKEELKKLRDVIRKLAREQYDYKHSAKKKKIKMLVDETAQQIEEPLTENNEDDFID